MTTDMRHLNFLEQVTEEDLAEIRRKESTYEGSWKKRGGIGAFFVSIRKVDRLEHIVAQHGYDVFKALEADTTGADGSALAELRDLRRYLTLIESEMLARLRHSQSQTRRTLENLQDLMRQPVTIGIDRGEELRPGTPEDGGQHARHILRLQDGLKVTDIDEDNITYYVAAGPVTGSDFDIFIVDRPRVPEELWEHLPRLPHDINNKEHEELQPEYRFLYAWENEKWRLKPEAREHWGREP